MGSIIQKPTIIIIIVLIVGLTSPTQGIDQMCLLKLFSCAGGVIKKEFANPFTEVFRSVSEQCFDPASGCKDVDEVHSKFCAMMFMGGLSSMESFSWSTTLCDKWSKQKTN